MNISDFHKVFLSELVFVANSVGTYGSQNHNMQYKICILQTFKLMKLESVFISRVNLSLFGHKSLLHRATVQSKYVLLKEVKNIEVWKFA